MSRRTKARTCPRSPKSVSIRAHPWFKPRFPLKSLKIRALGYPRGVSGYFPKAPGHFPGLRVISRWGRVIFLTLRVIRRWLRVIGQRVWVIFQRFRVIPAGSGLFPQGVGSFADGSGSFSKRIGSFADGLGMSLFWVVTFSDGTGSFAARPVKPSRHPVKSANGLVELF